MLPGNQAAARGPGTLRINMRQFRARWRDYSDNINLGEAIRTAGGNFLTRDAAPYQEALNDFGIFYTLTP